MASYISRRFDESTSRPTPTLQLTFETISRSTLARLGGYIVSCYNKNHRLLLQQHELSTSASPSGPHLGHMPCVRSTPTKFLSSPTCSSHSHPRVAHDGGIIDETYMDKYEYMYVYYISSTCWSTEYLTSWRIWILHGRDLSGLSRRRVRPIACSLVH